MSDHRNRLADETSPYLLQHAANPVDWFPWGPEALDQAKTRDKPIFLSIGYSACHWCHVMEHESFENETIAEVMNECFVNVKVDREERPDLDGIYMSAVQLMTRQGGWPMSVWLTPDLKPFYGGTYFPPAPKFGRPGFPQLCLSLAEAWRDRREEVLQAAERATDAVQRLGVVDPPDDADLDPEMVRRGGEQLLEYVDPQYGGLGRAPKFPHSVELRLMLRAWHRDRSRTELRDAVVKSLLAMVRGGIYDQLGGGFHRYSVDQVWLAPHFEKMLYDNALIPLACLEAWQSLAPSEKVSGTFSEGGATPGKVPDACLRDEKVPDTFSRGELKTAVTETMEYVLREMTHPDGGFYSTQDADSEGEEGRFFVWSAAEVEQVLGDDADLFMSAYDVSPAGNWEGKSILRRTQTWDSLAAEWQTGIDELQARLAGLRARLFEVRKARVAPATDTKILTAWNGLMIGTLATAGRVLDVPRWRDAAAAAADFVLRELRTDDGRLLRTWRDGRAKLNGYLEDYAFLADGLIGLYESTFDPERLRQARVVIGVMIDQFHDADGGGFFTTGAGHETLIARGKDPDDNAIPSGNAVAATALARLVKLTGDADLSAVLDGTLALFADRMKASAMATAQMQIALSLHAGPTAEIAVAGEPSDDRTQALLATVFSLYLPDKVVAAGVSDRPALLSGKAPPDGRPAAYVCEDFACRQPVADPDELRKLLTG